MENKIYIKNMVCDRCKMAVQTELERAGLPFQAIELGEVTLSKVPTPEQLDTFRNQISGLGFELIEDKTARIVSQIKNAALHYVRQNASLKKLKFSVFLGEKLAKEYNYLSSLFSEIEGTTIEQYLIHQKIERVKELLVYDELSLSQISYELGYSSVQHLSNQFKKVTGLTPSHFKQVKEKKRKPLDQV
jgi:YesN/AraC family two-component response regulator